MEDIIPTRHKSGLTVTELPESLKFALRIFLLGERHQGFRKEGATHRSMLVNVSQFTKVQDQVEALLRDELTRIPNASVPSVS